MLGFWLNKETIYDKINYGEEVNSKMTKAKRRIYDVISSENGWQVKRRGAKRASSVHRTKDEAIAAAIEIARNQKPSQIVIHRRDGTIQEERTYGKDPYPPEG